MQNQETSWSKEMGDKSKFKEFKIPAKSAVRLIRVQAVAVGD